MPLTYKSDLDTLPFDLHAKIQVRTSVRLAVRVVTDTQTDTQTDDVKTITPDTSQTWGVIIIIIIKSSKAKKKFSNMNYFHPSVNSAIHSKVFVCVFVISGHMRIITKYSLL